MAPHRLIRSGLTAALGVGFTFAIAWSAAPAAAQQSGNIRAAPHSKAKGMEDFDVAEAEARMRSLFRLFGDGDRAWTSLRMVGDNRMFETNTGPGDDRNLWSGGTTILQFNTESGSRFQTFGHGQFLGAPRSEWVNYLVEGVESLRNVRGDPPGYTVLWNGNVFGRPKDFNAADGLVGSLLSGVVSTEDASCRDHSAQRGGANMPAGFQLLPGSNCPETWSLGGTTWQGDRPIAADTWVDLFDQQGEDFRWNRWQVPDDQKDPDKFMGNNFSTYGHYNDFNSTTLRKFGDVIPGNPGSATRQGYPLGIDFVFNSFTFTIPTVANAQFWAGLLINNSEQLYGVPHDYDSLYWGLGPWPGRAQDGDNYVIVERGAWVSSESSDAGSPDCARTTAIPLIGNSCGGFGGAIDGFDDGAHGVMVLKSPIGDLRNKLFTTPGPFFLPSHPLAGDTITFNHAVNWNFGPWGQVWNQGTDRRRFGVLSDTRENTLDGTACADFADNFDTYFTFHSPEWPDGDRCLYKAYVPGWSYVSGRPSGLAQEPDTLFLDDCGETGCPVAWADTTWRGWSATSWGNLSQFSIGPFRLEAGDTTEIILALWSGNDSTTFVAFQEGIYDFYLGLFQGPEAPPAVTIQDLDLGAGIEIGSVDDATVTLTWDDAAENYIDPFLAKFADDMEAAPAGTELATIRDANDGIVDRIRDRAANNLEQLLIYRSCDAGGTFDSNADCVGDPAVDNQGRSVPPGWEAYSVLGPDGSGDFPNIFTDGNVIPGVTYLYSILGQSIGFIETVVNDDPACVNPCNLDTLQVAASLLNPLSTSAADPNVTSVYVPVSVGAGGSIAQANIRMDMRTELGRSVESMDLDRFSTMPFDVLLNSGNLQESNFTVRWGNFIEITVWDDVTTGDPGEQEADSTRVRVMDLANTVPDLDSTTPTTMSLKTRSWKRTDGIPVTLNGGTLVSETVNGDLVTSVFEMGPGDLDPDLRSAIGFVLIDNSAGVPLLASDVLTGDNATPGAFIANPGYPGFFVSADNRDARDFDQEFWMDANGDTLSADLDPTLNFDQAPSNLISTQGLTFGEYLLEFTDLLFGPGQNNTGMFLLDLANPAFDPSALDADFMASMASRTGVTTVTDPEAEVLVGDAAGLDTAEFDLAAATVPFEISNLTHGRGPLELAMIDRGDELKLLGIAPDTVSVTVPADQWYPNDNLYVIETMEVLQTDTMGLGAIVVDANGDPVTETVRVLSFAALELTCGGANATCNPTDPDGFGFGGYTANEPTDELHILFFSPFENESRYAFSPTEAESGDDIIENEESIVAQMDSITAVPNPYLFFSSFEQSGADRRIMFTHLPPDGSMRIYTVSGSFVQELDWTPADLSGNGDLFWDLQTREGNDVGGGLFIYVVTAEDPATGNEVKKIGKLVIIR